MANTQLTIRQKLLEKDLTIFAPKELQTLMNLNARMVSYHLEKGVKSDLFIQLKKGLYALKTDPPSEQEIANHLYQPSYISFEYALAHYNILPEMVYTVTSATTKATREYIVENKSFHYTTIKVAAYTGYQLQNSNDIRFQIADPEKALVDYLYLKSLGRRAFSDRLTLTKVNKTQAIKYATLFNSHPLLDLIGKLKF